MEGNEKLEMSLFDSDLELNLNLGLDDVSGLHNPETTEDIDDVDDTPQDTPVDDENIITTEDEDPEDVGGDQGTDDGSDDATSPNLYSSFASELHKEGVLPSLDLEKAKIDNTNDLASVIKSQIDTQARDYIISKIGEDGFDALESGISLAQYQNHIQTVQNLEAITDDVIDSDLELAKKIILEDYVNQGLDDTKAKRILQKSIDLGEDSILEDAKESIKSLRVFQQNKLEADKLANQERQKSILLQQEKIDNDLKSTIYNKKEIIKDIPLNKTIQDRVYQSITKVVSQSPDGVMENQLMKDRRENPIEFDTKLYYLYELTNGFQDFSKISKNVTTKAVSDFEKALRQAKFEGGGNPTFVEDGDSYQGIGGELVID